MASYLTAMRGCTLARSIPGLGERAQKNREKLQTRTQLITGGATASPMCSSPAGEVPPAVPRPPREAERTASRRVGRPFDVADRTHAQGVDRKAALRRDRGSPEGLQRPDASARQAARERDKRYRRRMREGG